MQGCGKIGSQEDPSVSSPGRFDRHVRHYRFGDYNLDLEGGFLLRGGEEVALRAKSFEVLTYLVERHGRLVTKTELIEGVWRDAAVTDNSLAQCLVEIRRALDDDAQRLIRTVARRGYIFVAPLTVPVVEFPRNSSEPAPTLVPAPREALNWEILDATDAATGASDPCGRQSSIAVLPFANMSADKENEYFGDGLAEEIVNVLARIPGMKVVGRTSSFFFRGKDIEVAEIGRRLNVEDILEGSVRKVGSRLRVSAQLIKAADGFHLWSGRYDREVTDLFAIQDEITEAIAGALRIKLSLDGATLRRHVPDLRAYEAFLRGREHLLVRPSPESLARGKELLEQAIQFDPRFALPYSIMGAHYTIQATLRPAREMIPLARAAQQEALRVDPSLPEAHALLGVCASMDYCWREAEAHWGLAMAREPVSRDVLFWYGNHYLLPTGRAAEAVRMESMVLDEDPLNLLYRRLYAIALQHVGRLVDAKGELRKVLEIDDPPWALSALGSVCAQQGRFEEALAATERAHALAPLDNSIAGQLAALLFRAGATRRADAMIEKLRCGQPYGAAAGLALFHALCGEFDQAARWAEKAVEERYPLFVAILGPFLRPSPQWPALAKLMNLPI